MATVCLLGLVRFVQNLVKRSEHLIVNEALISLGCAWWAKRWQYLTRCVPFMVRGKLLLGCNNCLLVERLLGRDRYCAITLSLPRVISVLLKLGND